MAEKEEFIRNYMESEVGLDLGVMLNRKMGMRPESSERGWAAMHTRGPGETAWREQAQ